MPLPSETQQQIKDLARKMRIHRGSDDGHWGGVVFLIGAGFSHSANIPLGAVISQRCTLELAKHLSFGEVATDDAERALQWLIANESWPAYDGDTPPWHSLYGWIFESQLTTAKDQRNAINRAISDGEGKINWAHVCLGELVRAHFVHTILTTNFDQLALEAVIKAGIIPVVADGLESLDRLDDDPKTPQVVHLHGSRHAYRPRNSISDVTNTTSGTRLSGSLIPLLRSNILVVCGYAGAEEGIMELLLRASEDISDLHVYWAAYADAKDKVSKQAQKLLDGSPHRKMLLNCDADEFMLQLMRELRMAVPSWMKDPVSHLENQAKFSDSQNDDIAAQVRGYFGRLQGMRQGLSVYLENEHIEEAKREASEARLAGNHRAILNLVRGISTDRGADAVRSSGLLGDLSLAGVQAANESVDPPLFIEFAELSQALLEQFKKADDPESWATLQFIYATAAQEIGAREPDTDKLREAIDAYNLALTVWSKDGHTYNYAWAHNNLGNALLYLSDFTEEPEHIELATKAFRSSIEVHPKESFPDDWVTHMGNLAISLHLSGKQKKDVSALQEAVALFHEVLKEYKEGSPVGEWLKRWTNLAATLTSLSKLNGNPVHVREAVDLSLKCLELGDRTKFPESWGNTQDALGCALTLQGELEHNADLLRDALQAHLHALEVFTPQTAKYAWATTSVNLACTWQRLGMMQRNADLVSDAVKAFDEIRPVVESLQAANLVRDIRENLPIAKKWLESQREIG